MTLFDSNATLQGVRQRIVRAAEAVGRAPDGVTLIAVSKQQPWEAIEPIILAGQAVFGENRVQEAQARWAERRKGLILHLIGPLQTNKVRAAVNLFDVIETVDRLKLARSLADEIQRLGRAPQLYIQINTGLEPQKAGIDPMYAEAFITTCRDELGLSIQGLMCIPSAGEPPSPHFALLGKIARRNGLSGLSMGMSDDFEVAVRMGATSVRVGRALFGPRQ